MPAACSKTNRRASSDLCLPTPRRLPASASVVVVVHCTDPAASFDFSRFGLPQPDTSRFTLRIADGVAQSIGWGESPPAAALPRSLLLWAQPQPATRMMHWWAAVLRSPLFVSLP